MEILVLIALVVVGSVLVYRRRGERRAYDHRDGRAIGDSSRGGWAGGNVHGTDSTVGGSGGGI